MLWVVNATAPVLDRRAATQELMIAARSSLASLGAAGHGGGAAVSQLQGVRGAQRLPAEGEDALVRAVDADPAVRVAEAVVADRLAALVEVDTGLREGAEPGRAVAVLLDGVEVCLAVEHQLVDDPAPGHECRLFGVGLLHHGRLR